MSVINAASGTAKWGSTTIDDVRNISITKTVNANEFGSSNTGGKTGRVKGREDVTGSFDIYFQKDADVPFSEGSEDTLVLTSDGSSELVNETVMITELGDEVPIEEVGLVSRSVSFGQQAR